MTPFPMASSDERLEDWLPPVGDEAFSIRCSDSSPDLCIIWARDHVHHYPVHLHDCVELVWIHAGWARIACRGATYQLKGGDVCVIAPNEPHSANVPFSGRCTFTILHLPSHLYWSIIGEHAESGKRLESFRILRYQALGLSINAVLDGFVSASDDAHRCHRLASLLEKVMFSPHSFASVRAEKSFWHPAVVHAREVMAHRRREALNLDEIAAEVGLNVRYFISLFKDGTGLPPHQYQIALRVEKAREMLQGLDMELSEVALDAGFSDQSHLSRLFKRSYGFTPGAFKQFLRPI